MKKKVVLLGFLCLLGFSLVSQCSAAENLAWNFRNDELTVEVWAQKQIYPGENLTITISVEAQKKIRNLYVTIVLSASEAEGSAAWNCCESLIYDLELQQGEKYSGNRTITTPEELDPGTLYAEIFMDWKVFKSPLYETRSTRESFMVVHLRNREVEQLRQSLQDLNSTFQDLKLRYMGSEANISGARNLSYVLMATTAVFGVSTGVLLLKRKKQQT